jgi:hypothetical protein
MPMGIITGFLLPIWQLDEVEWVSKGAVCRSTATSRLIFALSSNGKEICK